MLFSRPGYTGTQRWSIFWGGDIPGSENFGSGPGTDLGLRSAIISQQRAAFLGIPIWGSDTGGYYQFKDREVFARWLEFSAFSGIMEIGGVGHARAVGHADDAGLRPRADRHLPALHAAPRDAAALRRGRGRARPRPGMPIVRPMPFVDRTDRRLADRWDQYLFGPDLLVAPVWKVGQRQPRRLPARAARGGATGTRPRSFTGPRTVTVDVPLDTILVFVRDGAVVPGP